MFIIVFFCEIWHKLDIWYCFDEFFVFTALEFEIIRTFFFF